MKHLFITTDNWQATIIRLTMALVIFPHGAQKALGVFNGFGFSGTMSFFTETLHLPYLIGLIVIATEFIGTISIILGFATRIWSALMICVFLGIIVTTHWEAGFFMDWFGQNPKPNNEGFEFDLLILGMSASLINSGSGSYSIDRLLSRQANSSSIAKPSYVPGNSIFI
jgi:putative oxidoreductase